MSWYSSTLIHVFWRLDEVRGLLVRLEQLDGQREHVLEVDPPGACLGALVVGVEAREEVGRDGRPIRGASASQRSGAMRRTLAHSMASAMSLLGVKR